MEQPTPEHKPSVVQGELFPREEQTPDAKESGDTQPAIDPKIINPNSFYTKLTPEQIEELERKDDRRYWQD